MADIMLCGIDCSTDNGKCNGYCTGKTARPPEATAEMVLDRKRRKALKAVNDAEIAWYEYFCACEVGDDRIRAGTIYERVRTSTRYP